MSRMKQAGPLEDVLSHVSRMTIPVLTELLQRSLKYTLEHLQ